ncbi:hypothetical protein M5689_002092 [Euphorbia peplus]|nr:hypothetical protein M5689_002092 [Euphorbia peplus]
MNSSDWNPLDDGIQIFIDDEKVIDPAMVDNKIRDTLDVTEKKRLPVFTQIYTGPATRPLPVPMTTKITVEWHSVTLSSNAYM